MSRKLYALLLEIASHGLGVLATARELGYEIPEPESDLDEFSGKFTMRMPRSLHRQLTQVAMIEGVSLNQYIVYLLGPGRIGAGGAEPVDHYRMIQGHREAVLNANLGVLLPEPDDRVAAFRCVPFRRRRTYVSQADRKRTLPPSPRMAQVARMPSLNPACSRSDS